MPGYANADNRFGPSQYIVGPTLGDGVNYTSIQTAINDAFATGGGTVILRNVPGSSYAQSFTVVPGVLVMGANENGEDAIVSVLGTISYGMGGVCAIANLSIIAAGAPAIDVLGAATGTMYIDYCNVAGGNLFPALRCASAAATVHAKNTTFVGNGTTANCLITLNNSFFENCFFQNGDFFEVNGGNPITIQRCRTSGCGLQTSAAATNILLSHTDVSSGADPALSIAGGSQITATNCDLTSQDGTGDAVQGTGTFAYADVVFSGTAENIAVGIAQTLIRWRPHGTAGTSVTAYKGTAGFDTTDFTVTDGFVEFTGTGAITTLTGDLGGPLSPVANNFNIVGGAGVQTVGAGNTLVINALTWTSAGGSGAVPFSEGLLVTAPGTTQTLPVGANDNILEIYYDGGAGSVVVQAQAGDFIRIGNTISSAGGTATSTAVGDFLRLHYRTATLTWYCTSPVGNWALA